MVMHTVNEKDCRLIYCNHIRKEVNTIQKNQSETESSGLYLSLELKFWLPIAVVASRRPPYGSAHSEPGNLLYWPVKYFHTDANAIQ